MREDDGTWCLTSYIKILCFPLFNMPTVGKKALIKLSAEQQTGP